MTMIVPITMYSVQLSVVVHFFLGCTYVRVDQIASNVFSGLIDKCIIHCSHKLTSGFCFTYNLVFLGLLLKTLMSYSSKNWYSTRWPGLV
jgi:hypothetical protein